ncbi:alkaline phosphatase family protein [Paenactinomyces guangxiensis]|uniref:Alkaline phosphatase family protein n=1 Tax=Paenactinomyces guangxiensis TaxID=1490290 RepID=A0A7W2A8W6_9BACL|nr:alkaline phosphatase family protein [Paenactinomyces guangxiensis]MBA4494629.1 alkaline phosphatase family protein [Paenactinomyces guangxiensis]MBH8591608.1 alkaline phosphatase family protein [Paenactinomyces guangxiensis]
MQPKMMFAIIALIVIGIFVAQTFKPDKAEVKPLTISPASPRPVMMIVIDSLMDAPLQKAIKDGHTPAMKFLTQNGYYYPRVVSGFPTMSVSIDSTLLTGTLPNQHKIFGLSYFHPEQNRLVNFGTGLREAFAVGLKTVVKDGMQNLNQQFLSKDVQTIHEAVDRPTASVNAMIYRGKKKHILKSPWLPVAAGVIPDQVETIGPDLFSFGTFSKIDPNSGHDQPWFRYGINDTFARMEIVSLIKQNRLPLFTIAYFPKNDDVVHKKGASATAGIRKADKELQAILDAFPSWEEAIQHVTFIILGDSGQADLVKDRQQAYIDLRKVLNKYSIMPLKRKKPLPQDQIVLCVNERMAYIYPMDERLSIREMVDQLRREHRLDIIAWKENGSIQVVSGKRKGKLEFRPGGDKADPYEQSWKLNGDLSILDLTVRDEKRIQYGMYPDVLARLSGVMDTAKRVIVVTCEPGYEMVGESSPTHKGASHGSLHQADSLVPMIVSGTESRPEHLRLIDFKNWILQLLSPDHKEVHTHH